MKDKKDGRFILTVETGTYGDQGDGTFGLMFVQDYNGNTIFDSTAGLPKFIKPYELEQGSDSRRIEYIKIETVSFPFTEGAKDSDIFGQYNIKKELTPIDILRNNQTFSLDKIEKSLGMPQGYLSRAIKNKRALPKEWEATLKKYLLNLAKNINEKMAY